MPRTAFIAALSVLALSLVCQAQVYKWTDANGKVHYSERKPEGPGGAEPQTVTIKKAPEAAPPPAKPKIEGPVFGNYTPPGANKPAPQPAGPRPESDFKDHGTADSRCRLARDILSGAAVYANGNPTDQYAREVAQNDVKAFCK